MVRLEQQALHQEQSFSIRRPSDIMWLGHHASLFIAETFYVRESQLMNICNTAKRKRKWNALKYVSGKFNTHTREKSEAQSNLQLQQYHNQIWNLYPPNQPSSIISIPNTQSICPLPRIWRFLNWVTLQSHVKLQVTR